MSEYYWDEKIEYLRKTRDLYYNDDYLQFLVHTVWKINEPVNSALAQNQQRWSYPMLKCPKCLELTPLQRHCSHCGEIIKHTNEEMFDILGEAVEHALKNEVRNRKKKKRLKIAAAVIITVVAVYIGLKS